MSKKTQRSLFTLLALGLLFALLRLPSLFEPHWYGDEGITLAVGQEISRGEQLYVGIADNKPPLFYQIAGKSRTIFNFRLATTIWVLLSLAPLWYLFRRLKISHVGLFAIIILLSIPLIEANIANGEVWFVPLTAAGMATTLAGLQNTDKKFFFLAGIFFGLGSLFKFPAVLDGAAAGVLLLTVSAGQFHDHAGSKTPFRNRFCAVSVLALGILTPWILVCLRMLTRDALIPFLNHTLINNIRYSGIWGTDPFFAHSRTVFKLGFLVIIASLVRLKRDNLPFALKFNLLWLAFSTVGTLLSNRPYNHYLLQTVPAWGLMLGSLISHRQTHRAATLSGGMLSLSLGIFFIYFFSYGPNDLTKQISYYQRFIHYSRHPQNQLTYIAAFDQQTPHHYRAAALINHVAPHAPTLIWSDDWNIYSLARLPVTGRYPADFLIHDQPRGYQSLNTALQQAPPEIIILSRPFRFPAPELDTIVQRRYHQIAQFDDIQIYEKI